MKKWYPPGSDEAVKHGCTCDRKANSNGRGVNGVVGIYHYDTKCKLHEYATLKPKNWIGVDDE